MNCLKVITDVSNSRMLSFITSTVKGYLIPCLCRHRRREVDLEVGVADLHGDSSVAVRRISRIDNAAGDDNNNDIALPGGLEITPLGPSSSSSSSRDDDDSIFYDARGKTHSKG